MAFDPIEEFADPYNEPRIEINPENRLDLNPDGHNDFAKVCCPSCNSDIAAEDLNIHDKIGKCIECNVVFPFDITIQSLQTAPQKIKQEILRPEGIDLFYFDDQLEIAVEQPVVWFEYMALFVSALLIIPILVGIIEERSLVAAFVAAVILFTGYTYDQWRKKKHKVFFTINDQNLNIQWLPKKLNREKNYTSNTIKQVYIKKDPQMTGWHVMMIVDEGKGQKHIKLTAIKSISKAKYLEQEIERHLGIQDIEVPEEVK